MGSSASYRAAVVIRRQRKLEIDEVNSQEEIQKFLQKQENGVYLKKVRLQDDPTLEDLENGTYYSYGFPDEEDWEGLGLLILWDKDKWEDFDDFVDDAYSYDFNDIYGLVKVTDEELSKLDLKILSEYPYYPTSVHKDTEIVSIWEDIYYDNDNSDSRPFTLSQEILDEISRGDASLFLKGSGSCY